MSFFFFPFLTAWHTSPTFHSICVPAASPDHQQFCSDLTKQSCLPLPLPQRPQTPSSAEHEPSTACSPAVRRRVAQTGGLATFPWGKLSRGLGSLKIQAGGELWRAPSGAGIERFHLGAVACSVACQWEGKDARTGVWQMALQRNLLKERS